jgi:hypothetical protein
LQKSESQSGKASESVFNMLIRGIALVLSVLPIISIGMAKDLPLGCFTNSYDKAHMAKHKGQTVTSIKMSILDSRKLENSNATLVAEFDVTLRGQGTVKWGEAAFCRGKSGAWTCQIDCDGGGFVLAEDANGITLLNSDGFRVAKDGGCGEENNSVDAKPGNRMFRLSKAKLAACK